MLCYNLQEMLASYKALQNLVLQNLISYNMLFKYLTTCKVLYRKDVTSGQRGQKCQGCNFWSAWPKVPGM